MTVAIRVEGLSKQYRIGSHARYKALRDVLAESLSAPARWVRSFGRQSPPDRAPKADTFWALDDISFEVKQGEVIGIIGHNGAGKSTLLKILSRITEPTRGYADINGRVGSLLEVGTGFHPELTGRENIYLNGAILGMRRTEIESKFDEIVAFAEIERFLDTPVKHYSTGMYLRLAFAVAVHLEPEVLIVDEVLAVGDAEFQKKCFQKMQEIGKGNRTILLVSHNMSAIRTICGRVLALERGHVVDFGPTDAVVDNYLAGVNRGFSSASTVETETFLVEDVRVVSTTGPVLKTFDPARICIRLRTKTAVAEPDVYLGIQSLDGHLLSALVCRDFCSVPALGAGQTFETEFAIESLPLLPGRYELKLHVVDVIGYKFEIVPATFPFEIAESSLYGGRKIDRWFGQLGLKAAVEVRLEETMSGRIVA